MQDILSLRGVFSFKKCLERYSADDILKLEIEEEIFRRDATLVFKLKSLSLGIEEYRKLIKEDNIYKEEIKSMQIDLIKRIPEIELLESSRLHLRTVIRKIIKENPDVTNIIDILGNFDIFRYNKALKMNIRMMQIKNSRYKNMTKSILDIPISEWNVFINLVKLSNIVSYRVRKNIVNKIIFQHEDSQIHSSVKKYMKGILYGMYKNKLFTINEFISLLFGCRKETLDESGIDISKYKYGPKYLHEYYQEYVNKHKKV